MTRMRSIEGKVRLAAGVALMTLSAWSALAADNPSWSVSQGELRVLCPMTVGGSFEAKTTSLTGTVALGTPRPPAFIGDLVVDLRTLDTGIDLRSGHMRDEYLEVGKGEGFEKAVLSNVRLADVDAGTFQGRTTFTGTLLLHGARKDIAGQAEIRREGSSVRVEATFPVVLADHGIPKPQYLGVGVKNQVQVKVSFVATPVSASAGGSR
ncbi:MAG: YceI family protein [Vicinamibacteria bacterium]